MDISKLVEELSEEEAVALHYAFVRKFGWATVLWTRGDVASQWDLFDCQETITDEEWDAVRATTSWRRFDEWLSEDSYQIASDAIREAQMFLAETSKGETK